MTDNLFFDARELGSCGRNVIIGRTVRIRYPELVHIGDNCIIDDFTYISTALRLEGFVHIAANCSVIGGRGCTVRIGRFSTTAPGVVLSAGSDDYAGGIATPFVPDRYKGAVARADITLGSHCIVGASSVVLPGVSMADGAAVGALSLVKTNLDGWTLYAGVPARRLRARDRDNILAMEKAFDAEHGR